MASAFALPAADFGKFIADETEKWAKVVKFAGKHQAGVTRPPEKRTFRNARSASGGGQRPLLALFCRANPAERCPLSGVDPPTYAQCEFFSV